MTVALGLAALAALAGVAAAQDTTRVQDTTGVQDTTQSAPAVQDTTHHESFIKAPVFLFMPGGVTANAISAGPGASSASGFLLRFQTTIPTATQWFTPVFGTQWLPNGLDGNGDNTPIFFYGFVTPILPPSVTKGWLTVSIDPLGVFAAGLGPADTRKPYGHDFFLEAAAVVAVGQKMMRNMGAFSNLAAYFLLDQRISHVPRDANGNRDYFAPTMLYGLVLPIAPWGK
jgi:hypothetical protein